MTTSRRLQNSDLSDSSSALPSAHPQVLPVGRPLRIKSMAYIANTPEDVRVMLGAIGLDSLDQLFDMIPAEYRLRRPLAIPEALSELELTSHIGSNRRPESRGRRPPMLPRRRELRPLHPRRRRQSGVSRASSIPPTRPIRPRRAKGRSRRPSSIRRSLPSLRGWTSPTPASTTAARPSPRPS